MKSLILLIGVCSLLSCSSEKKTENSLGHLPFDVTGSDQAVPAFQKGLLLMHNFEYYDATEAFIEAQNIDSTFAMAYWGEAMTYNHPVWGDVDVEKARTALRKLGDTQELRIERAATELEKDFIRAVDILFGEGSKPERDNAYADFMEKLYQRHPGNHEVAAFYALSLLGIKEDWRNYEDVNVKAADIAKMILNENPTHPGALHYLIHADDHPDYAQYALAAANAYAKLASYAGHALHMPSHIYLALGMWDDVIRSNEVSWAAGVDRKKAKELTNDALNYHAHLWLQYGYLQQGRYEDARVLLENQIAFNTAFETPRSRFHLLRMKGHYLFEAGEWDNELADLPIETKDLALEIRSVNYLINGTKAFKQDDEAGLLHVLQEMETDIATANYLKKENDNITICGVTSFVNTIPSTNELKNSEMIRLELNGMLAWMKNDVKGAESFFRQAVANDESYVTGPPDFLKLSREYLGEFLLTRDKPKEALEQFEAALKLAPNRLPVLRGGLEAARRIGDKQKIDAMEKLIGQRFSTDKKSALGA